MKSSVPRRGVQDIRTMSERISVVDNPQKKYLALAMLELERARRTKEKRSAGQRVANIDQRLADISAEQEELLAAAEAELETEKPATRRRRAVKSKTKAENGFKISY
jgi:hypothetical protein